MRGSVIYASVAKTEGEFVSKKDEYIGVCYCSSPKEVLGSSVRSCIWFSIYLFKDRKLKLWLVEKINS